MGAVSPVSFAYFLFSKAVCLNFVPSLPPLWLHGPENWAVIRWHQQARRSHRGLKGCFYSDFQSDVMWQSHRDLPWRFEGYSLCAFPPVGLRVLAFACTRFRVARWRK